MITFQGGPAEADKRAHGLCIKRAPLYLRIVRDSRGQWDALDQLGDFPKSDETVFVYRKVEDHGSIHLRRSKPGTSGWFMVAVYEYIEPQPSQDVLESNAKWAFWARKEIALKSVLDEVTAERRRQVEEKGHTAAKDDGNAPTSWAAILSSMIGDVYRFQATLADFRKCMVQVAAVAVAAVESCDRKTPPEKVFGHKSEGSGA